LNALDASYLQLKNAIMQDKNLTDKEKQQALAGIESRMSALAQLKAQVSSGLVNESAKPYLEELAYQE
jgi:two-component sensor histidine kinase